MPYFSIIVPVYNVAPYLREALDSVLAQTFTDWECLCVDDGSTDGSGKVLDAYAKRDVRFKVFRKENSGVSSARNYALKKAQGKYLFFLDSDDCIAPECLKVLGETMERTRANFASCNVQTFFPNGKSELSRPTVDAHIARADFLRDFNLIDTSVVWGKAFDRVWWISHDFQFNEEMTVSEDSLMMFQLVCYASAIAHIGSCVGYYYKAAGIDSLMTSHKNDYPRCRAIAFEKLLLLTRCEYDSVTLQLVGRWIDYVYYDVCSAFKKGGKIDYKVSFSYLGWKVAAHNFKWFVKWILILILQRI